ncbi:MAG TPA: DEAD/DEAH box helicase [Thermoplasmata archaeon]|nr:DEAD/DEAH box helicase [Thermoplasmata archaeon]
MNKQAAKVISLFTDPLQESIRIKGFSELTEPQIKAIPWIIKGNNVLLIAPTGSGKTEAAFLPIVDALVRDRVDKKPGIKAIYVTPLRALNRDLVERLKWWCKRLDIKLGVRHGDTPQRERETQAMVPPDILITTPETLQAILPGKILGKHLRSVRWVVVDEVHELASEKRGSQLSLALERLRFLKGGDFQLIGLSATIGTPEKVAKFLVGGGRKCRIINVPLAREMRLKVYFPKADPEDYKLAKKLYTYPEVASRLRLIRGLIEQHRSTLVFTNTRSISEVLGSRFKVWDLNFPLGVHHGSLSRPSRVGVEKGIKEGKLQGIVCTSSLELGIDIGKLELVIQYNSPRQVTRLMQRVGRSGHRVKGVAQGAIVVQDSDDGLEALVIARRALREDLEPVEIPEKPFDVLTHQLAGMLLMKRRWGFEEALDLLKKAYPLKNLSEQEFVEVLDYMYTRYPRLLWFSPQERIFARAKRIDPLYKYYFENLSMIPEERHFLVVEEEGDKPVGVLDEAFVAEYGDPGNKFIEGGSVWKILYLYKNRIYVKNEIDPLGSVPSWVGDEIPVPFEVANEVGEIRRWVEQEMKRGVPTEELIDEFGKKYPADKEMLRRILGELILQIEGEYPVPTDKLLTIERFEEYVILHCSFGLKVNRTLARMLGSLLADRIGAFVPIQQDPYRIVFRTDLELKTIREAIHDLSRRKPEGIKQISLNSLVKSRLFKRRFIHVLRRFGALAKNAPIGDINLDNLISSYEESAVFKEAVKDALEKDMDVKLASLLLKKVESGEIKISLIRGVSPIGRVGVEELRRKTDLIPPKRMKQVIIKYARARLLDESLTLICTNCWRYAEAKKIKDVDEIVCPECNSSKIGALNEEEDKVMRALRKRSRTGKIFKDALSTAEVVSKYGKPGLTVLASRGISVNRAKSILEKEREFNDHLIDLIIEEERESLKDRFYKRG